MQLKYFFYFLLATVYTAATSFTIDSANYTPVDTASEQPIYKLDLQLSVDGVANYAAGKRFRLFLDRVHHISLPFDNSNISIYLKNDNSLLFQSSGIKDASSDQSDSFGKGTIIDFVASKAFNVPQGEKLTMYLTLHAVFITGNDFYFYKNGYSISTVTPGNNNMGISVSASVATNAFMQGVLATPSTVAAVNIASPTATATPTYNLDVQLQWVQASSVLGVSTPVPVLEVFGTVYPSCANAYSFVTANYRADFDSQLSLPTNAQYSYTANPSDMNVWTSIGANVSPAKATAIQKTTLSDGSVETEVLFQITSGANTNAYYMFGALAVPTNSNYNGYYGVSHIGSIVCASGADTTTQRWNTVQQISMVRLANSGYATESTETSVTTSTWNSSTTSATTSTPPPTDVYNNKTVQITLYVPTPLTTSATTVTTVVPSTVTLVTVSTSQTTDIRTETTVIITTETDTSVTTVPTTLTSTATSQTTFTTETTQTDTKTLSTEVVTTETLTSTTVTDIILTSTITDRTSTTTYETDTIITTRNITSTSSYFTTEVKTITEPFTIVTTENVTTVYTLTRSSTNTIETDTTVTQTNIISTTSNATSLVTIPTTTTLVVTFNTTYTTGYETTATNVNNITTNITNIVTYNTSLTTGFTNILTKNITSTDTQVIPTTVLSTSTVPTSVPVDISSVPSVSTPSSTETTPSIQTTSLVISNSVVTPQTSNNVVTSSVPQSLAGSTGVPSTYPPSLVTTASTPVMLQSSATPSLYIYTGGAIKNLVKGYNSMFFALAALLLA